MDENLQALQVPPCLGKPATALGNLYNVPSSAVVYVMMTILATVSTLSKV